MASLMIGLIAALFWGLHDIFVRYVTQSTGVLPALTTVLVTGCLVLAAPSLVWGDWSNLTQKSGLFSVLSGLVYVLGCIGLYKAFAIGPVRLVAPIVGAYPILSIAWAGISGQPVSWDQWLAVLFVVAGVAIVGSLSPDGNTEPNSAKAIGWAILGGSGFAIAFALGHIAVQAGDELSSLMVTRLTAAAFVTVILLCAKNQKAPTKGTWPLLGAMALLDTLALSIVISAGSLQNPEYAAVAASLFGLITVFLAWVFLKERMSIGQWGGVVIAFSAIAYLAI